MSVLPPCGRCGGRMMEFHYQTHIEHSCQVCGNVVYKNRSSIHTRRDKNGRLMGVLLTERVL